MAIKKKTIKDVKAFLDPLYKKGKTFIIQEKDYLWIQPILSPKSKYERIKYRDEDVWFDTIQSDVKTKKLACRWCGRRDNVIKFYIIADNLEEPKPYHPGCIRKLEMEVMMKLSDTKSQIE